jgi:hypothetical protein
MTLDPFAVTDAPAAAPAATEKQRDWVKQLTAEAAAMARLIGDEDRAKVVEGADFTATFLDRSATSVVIDRMMRANDETKAAHGIKYPQIDAEVQRAHNARTAALGAGIYLVDETVYRVAISKNNRPYAYVLKTSEDELGEPTSWWEYEGGAIKNIPTDAAPITVDQAAAFGHRTKVCAICATPLKNKTSLQRGIGPVCYGKMTG